MVINNLLVILINILSVIAQDINESISTDVLEDPICYDPIIRTRYEELSPSQFLVPGKNYSIVDCVEDLEIAAQSRHILSVADEFGWDNLKFHKHDDCLYRSLNYNRFSNCVDLISIRLVNTIIGFARGFSGRVDSIVSILYAEAIHRRNFIHTVTDLSQLDFQYHFKKVLLSYFFYKKSSRDAIEKMGQKEIVDVISKRTIHTVPLNYHVIMAVRLFKKTYEDLPYHKCMVFSFHRLQGDRPVPSWNVDVCFSKYISNLKIGSGSLNDFLDDEFVKSLTDTEKPLSEMDLINPNPLFNLLSGTTIIKERSTYIFQGAKCADYQVYPSRHTHNTPLTPLLPIIWGIFLFFVFFAFIYYIILLDK